MINTYYVMGAAVNTTLIVGVFWAGGGQQLLFTVPCTPLQGSRPIKLRLQASSPSPSGDFSMGWMRYSLRPVRP